LFGFGFEPLHLRRKRERERERQKMKWKKEYKSEKQAMKLMLDTKAHLSQKNIKKVKSTFQRGQFGFSSFFTSQPTIGL